jgi:enamine deaminase RidA (YjgF/YER057c/UK114 family)
MQEIKRLHTNDRMSQAVIYGGAAVFLAGQVASDRNLDVRGQTREILENIDRLLSECGTSRAKLLTAQVWLADIRDFDAMNEVWDGWVPKGAAPARACIESRMARPDIRVEIQVVAAA